jgi:hypothetical protein
MRRTQHVALADPGWKASPFLVFPYQILFQPQENSMLLTRHCLVAILAVFCFTLKSSAGFNTAPAYPAGPFPGSLAVADFNGDGILDLAVPNSFASDDTVSILLGKGDGSFQNPQSYHVGAAPGAVAVADFNGDGNLDLAVSGSDGVSILLGKGDGTFQDLHIYSTGYHASRSNSSGVVIADLNGDGTPDVAEANIDGTLSVLLGHGDGTFQRAQNYETAAVSVAVGDFDGDGVLDLVVATGNESLGILFGKGDGSFQNAQSVPVDGTSYSVAVGDFNGDGILDVTWAGFGNVAHVGGNAVVGILLGNGDGTFPRSDVYAAGQGSITSLTPEYFSGQGSFGSLALGDFNNDGHLDWALAGSGGVNIFLGNGDGTLLAARSYAPAGFSVAVGDFNGDGILDLAVPHSASGTVSILLGSGQGFFHAAQNFAAGSHSESVAAADFNGDGLLDLAVTNRDLGTLSILLGNGDGSFQTAQSYPVGSGPNSLPIFVAVGDFNGDRIPDLAVACSTSSTISILLGNGDGSFQAAQNFPAGNGINSLAVGDFNADGKADIISTNYEPGGGDGGGDSGESDVRVFLGNGDGTFQPSNVYFVGTDPDSVAVADFNGDGILDLAVVLLGSNIDQGTIKILLGKGDGSFQAGQGYSVGVHPAAVAVGDFNGDGILDLAVADGGANILLGNGDGTFQPAKNYAAASFPLSIAVGDFNGDGIPDLAVGTQNDMVSILLGNGDGTFQAAKSYPVGIGPHSLAVGDFNGDGMLDLSVANDFGTVTILLNAGDWGN